MKRSLSSFPQAGTSRSEMGSALVIVLCFVVLLTVVVLAMLSHSLFSGLISNASSNVSKSDLYGHGAINQIIGDLRQEIVAGSMVASMSSGNIYRPSTVAASVPYNSGPYTVSIFNTIFPNLVKESTYNVAFEPYDTTVPMRAANVLSTAASLNGRYVSTTRWNKALLLPKASATFTGGTGGTALSITSDTGTATTPVNTFVAPDWIMTAVDGTNPTSWPASPGTTIANPKSTSYVVGRYAYTIYNEGGLLDANVAGCPAPITASFNAAQKTILSRKGPSAFADLTQLPGIASLTSSSKRPQQVVDTLVGWRNVSSSQATTSAGTFPNFPTYTFGGSSVGNYLNYLLGLTSNFMSTGNGYATTGLYYNTDPNSGQNLTDQYFAGRQQMISFFQDVGKTASEQAYLQDAMMYLGTFSRSLNQPSYWPDPSRPAVVGPPQTTLTVASGTGNSAYQYDGGGGGVNLPASGNASPYTGIHNPPFKGIQVAGPGGWLRNDGTKAVTGEPLVKKRFALNRLMWLTYKGPSFNVPTSDALYTQYQAIGVPTPLLNQMWNEGTTTNLQNYFGLTWAANDADEYHPRREQPRRGHTHQLSQERHPAVRRWDDGFRVMAARLQHVPGPHDGPAGNVYLSVEWRQPQCVGQYRSLFQ